jgi:hypothetical protein
MLYLLTYQHPQQAEIQYPLYLNGMYHQIKVQATQSMDPYKGRCRCQRRLCLNLLEQSFDSLLYHVHEQLLVVD